MATILAVNAQTGQAVGAFNQLANAIANARGQFGALNTVINNGAAAARTYANAGIKVLETGFDRLKSILSGVFDIMKSIAAGIGFVFNAVIRELDKLQGFNAIMTVSTNSSAEAAGAYEFLRKTADKLGIQFDAISSNYAKLVAAIPDGADKMRVAEKVFLGISMAARTLHASNQDTQLMFYAVTQIASKGVVSMEELRRQLGEKLPGVMQIAAKALNTVPDELEKAIRKGIVISDKFLPVLGDALIRTFADSSEKASASVSAAINRLTNVWVDFVKNILDSGAGQAIVNMFDALREKLQDPYIVERFGILIKYLADQFTLFVKSLTADDIRNGFDTSQKFLEAFVKVLQQVVTILTWIINNGGKAGAIIGGLGGAAVGAVAGPWGAAAGAVIGAGAGAYAGSQLSSTPAQLEQRVSADKVARALTETDMQAREDLKYQRLMPLLQSFSGLNSLKGLENLMKTENLTQKTLNDLVEIRYSTAYKTEAARAQAVRDYSKFGTTMSATGANLSDVLGGKGKTDKGAAKIARQMDDSLWKAHGFDANFIEEQQRYFALFKSGKLSVEQYDIAYGKLLAKQPFMQERIKLETKAQKDLNDATSDDITFRIKQLNVRDDVNFDLNEQLRLSKLRNDELQVETQLQSVINKLTDAGWDVSEGWEKSLRERIKLAHQSKEVTAAEDAILAQTVDKYRAMIVQQQALDRLVADPTSGVTNEVARDFTVQIDPGFQGSGQWINAERRALEEYYSYINGLRTRDRIDEEAANLAKQRAQLDTTARIREAYVEAARLRVEAGSTDWADNTIAVLGRLANGFRTFASGASNALGNFFESFTDGFANSVGRAIVYSENLGDALKVVAQEGISQLISAMVKLGIQWLVNEALGKSISSASMASQLALTTTAAAATAAAWAPAAAMVSLASFGANAAPAAAGITGTVALSQALAMIGGAGFETGGYTGSRGRKQVAGVVHGQEFVVNADATSRYRPLLESINNGNFNKLSGYMKGGFVKLAGYQDGGYVKEPSTIVPMRDSGTASAARNVQSSNTSIVIENHGAEITKTETRRPDGGTEVRMIVKAAVAEVVRQINSGGPVAQSMKSNGVNMNSRLARRG